MATCAEILNIKLDQSDGVDSFSMVPLFSKATQDNFERSYTIHHAINGSFAIRKGMYKFIFCPSSGGWSIPKPSQNETKNLPKFQLYNLDNDPSETNTLYGKFPKLEDELIEIFKQLAIINGEAGVYEPIVEFENEWGDDFEFTPDFNIDDNPEEDK